MESGKDGDIVHSKVIGQIYTEHLFEPASKRHNVSGGCSNLTDLTVLLEREMYKQTVALRREQKL